MNQSILCWFHTSLRPFLWFVHYLRFAIHTPSPAFEPILKNTARKLFCNQGGHPPKFTLPGKNMLGGKLHALYELLPI
jgi:hypothetical protein